MKQFLPYNLNRNTMFTFNDFIVQISPIIIIPFIALAVFIILYFVYLKYSIWKEIQNLPVSILNVDVSSVKKNLQIKSMVCNFILIISFIEFLSNIAIETKLIGNSSTEEHYKSPRHLSNSCSIYDNELVMLEGSHTFLHSRIRNIGEVLITEIPILMALFYVILRRMYLNVSYHEQLRKYIVYIVLQFAMKSLLVCFMQTYYIGVFLDFPFALIDFGIYISTSQKFYSLLKGMRNSASLHSTKYDYIEKKRIVKRFFRAQVVTICVFSFLLLVTFLCLVQVPFRILDYNPCYLSYISFGIIPDLIVSHQTEQLAQQVRYYCTFIEMASVFLVEIIGLIIYVGLCIDIIVISVRKRRKYTKKNFWLTRPLLERYRKSLLM